MYKIEIPHTIHQLMGIFYRLEMWSDEEPTLGESCRKICYFLFIPLFALSTAVGALNTEDKDERVYLTVVSIAIFVMAYRMWIVLWQRNRVLSLLHQFGEHSTNDENEFIRINNHLDIFMKFIRYYFLFLVIGSIFATIVLPIASEKHLIFNIAFPFNRKNSDIAFWIAASFVCGGFFFGLVSVVFTKIIWYLMLGISFEYEILGNHLRHMGAIRKESAQVKVSLAAQQQAFYQDFILAIQTYGKINEAFEEFAEFFGNLFFMQIATGSICICGSTYALGFSSYENIIEILVGSTFLMYSFFDIFVVMYLGNEIKLSSDRLSQCVYESNWIEQPQFCKKCIIIFTERLKRPHELIVVKLYPLNLLTFTSIVNSAYSLFNILQNVR